ncbi:MAG: helical backbone metal receptor [Planctomycetota bacterium]|nr:helical backbone metal receptor [Planctomycetota bacterium]
MRIVSLCPSLTELVFDLGRGDELVGITKYCVRPADRVGAVEKVGGTKNPDIDRIVELAPEVVLLNEEENRVEDAEALQSAGVHCHVSFPRNVSGTAEMVRSIGAELGRGGEAKRITSDAESIARDIEERSERVRRAARERPPVRFAYLIWRKPWMTVNADTFAHDLLAQAGGVNVFAAKPERYPEVALDELRESDPELVLLGTEPFPFEQKHADELAEEAGLPRERFRVADGEYLSWHGSRTPDGIDYAEDLIRAAAGRGSR